MESCASIVSSDFYDVTTLYQGRNKNKLKTGEIYHDRYHGTAYCKYEKLNGRFADEVVAVADKLSKFVSRQNFEHVMTDLGHLITSLCANIRELIKEIRRLRTFFEVGFIDS